MKKALFCLGLLLAPGATANLWSQSNQELGLMPSLNLRYDLRRDWALNFKWESRQPYRSETEKFEYLLSDFSLLAVKRTGLRSSLAGGYLLRLEQGASAHRFLQQWSWVKAADYISWAHRLASDQTIEEGEAWSLRLRYRIAGELAVQGRNLDPGEFFLKAHQELLGESQAGRQRLEGRSALLGGYLLSPNVKIEAGIEYRYPGQRSPTEGRHIWFALNLYAKI